jgi:trans-2-enoyl-CoA reductase
MKALRYSRFGVPEDVAELVDEADASAPGAGEVTVRPVAMPLHPADLLAMEGRYGARQPRLPAFGGTDGVGRVTAVGIGVKHLREGDLVPLLFAGVPTWREAFTVDAQRMFALPPGNPVPLSVVGVNALTAWALLNDMVTLPANAWVLQNAAASSVGLAASQIGQRAGLRMINVVRDEAEAARLRAAGANTLLFDGADLPSRIADITEGDLPRLAIDAVAGGATARLAACVASGGVVVNYGLLSGEPPAIASTDLLFRQVSLRGFWLKAWLRDQDVAQLREVYGELAQLTHAGVISAPIAATYPLDQYRDALRHAASYAREGKVLFVESPGLVAQDEAARSATA